MILSVSISLTAVDRYRSLGCKWAADEHKKADEGRSDADQRSASSKRRGGRRSRARAEADKKVAEAQSVPELR